MCPACVRRAAARALLFAATIAGCASTSAQDAVPADHVYPGARRFEFSGWPGPVIPVWTFRASGAGTDAPVLIVMHGVNRDADRYLSEWAPLAEAASAMLVVPEFSARDFPGSKSYNLGGVTEAERGRWTYSAIEPIFDAVVAREGLTARGYRIYGHSAGAQFVHRFVLLGAGARTERALAANAGWYTFPTPGTRWPFGLGGLTGAPPPEPRYAAPLLLLLGDEDTDTADPNLSRSDGAMAQGPHRHARGLNFYAAARADAANRGIPLRWSCRIAPGVPHSNALAARHAVTLLFGPVPAMGGDCAVLPPLPAGE